ncbi:MAG: DUF1294 domain-containing protein [Planctomycetes bacterium]|nr:DUF1294 domain-containing protein [Planctomycetota bacterium]
MPLGEILLILFLSINLLAFLCFSLDKYLAIRSKNRISERTLLIFTFIGGWPGATAAMLIFRHKTSKMSFLWKFWLMIFLNFGLGIAAYFLFFD